MPLGDITVHVAVLKRTQRTTDPVERVDGEIQTVDPEDEGDEDTAFDCFLQIPKGTEGSAAERPGRQVRRPTLLYEPDGWQASHGDELIQLSHEDRLLITAEELTGPEPVEWAVDGSPEPLAAPGDLIGYEARLLRVDE